MRSMTLALGLFVAGCQCGPAMVGTRPLDGGGMDATVGDRDAGDVDAGDVDAAGRDAAARDGGGTDSGSFVPVEIYCDDGVDQDGDGDVDCADDDCDLAPCDAMGNTCRMSTCGGCRGEPTETACGDGADEDCDGLRDCADPDCAGMECGPGMVVCADGACPCESGFTEWLCGDGTDDDCDGMVDCLDTDCAGARCSDTGMVCLDGSCGCPSTAELCEGSDEDCSGIADEGCPESLDQGTPTTMGPVGGPAGTAWLDPCPMGMALVGIAGRASSRIERLQPICAVVRFVTDETMTIERPEWVFTVERGAPVYGAAHGGGAGTEFEDVCPTNRFVSAVEGHAENALERIALRCASFSIARDDGFNWRLRQAPGGSTPSRGGAGTGDFPFTHDCGTNGLVTGFEGRADTFVNAIATTCRTLSLDLR